MKILYTDASFDYKHTEETPEKFVRGKIAISDGKTISRVEKVVIGKVPELKQYINILELTAVARAVELASGLNVGEIEIRTDSKVAMYWARNGKIKPAVLTVAHTNALEYLKVASKQFGGAVTFNHIPREKNPAGFLLAAELEKEPPHTK